jgi:DNA (cytosine-5)-methyltransferase 1
VKFISVCSGIEAASVAWNPLGWHAVAFAEIEPFPCSVLAHHYPSVPNLGDMTKFKDWPDATVDLLCGGTPCQSFSVAGLRKGLADPRGNLMLTFGAIAARYRPRWLVWENVPGVLSSNGGADFGAFLGMLGELGYGFAYRVLDAQYFGVPQRRRRVFVVGCLGDWRSAAAVLFERHSLSGHLAPSREARQTAPTIPSRSTAGGGLGTDFDCDGGLIAGPSMCLNAKGGGGRLDAESETLIPTIGGGFDVAHALTGEGLDASEDGTGRGTPLVPVCFSAKDHGSDAMQDCSPTLRAGGHSGSHANAGVMPAVALALRGRAGGATAELGDEVGNALRASSGGGDKAHVMAAMQVRRLTPRECLRLQGFPDDYLDVMHRGKPAADGPKYKAIGNSWAVPCVRWIGQRIQQVEALHAQREEIAA